MVTSQKCSVPIYKVDMLKILRLDNKQIGKKEESQMMNRKQQNGNTKRRKLTKRATRQDKKTKMG